MVRLRKPSSFFFKIYIGIVGSLVLVVSAGHFAAQYAYEYRVVNFLAELSRVPARLMARHYHEIDNEDDRQAYQRYWATRMDGNVGDYPIDSQKLSRQEQDLLASGETVVRYQPNAKVAIFLQSGRERVFRITFRALPELGLRLNLEILRDHLQPLSPEKQTKEVNRLKRDFAYPVRLLERGHSAIDGEIERRVQQDMLLIRLGEDNPNQRIAFAAVGDRVVRLGPIEVVEALPTSLITMIVMLALFIQAVIIYLLALRFETRMQHTKDFVEKISEGDFSVPQDETYRDDSLGRLRETLSNMSQRIGHLLNTQKEMIRAVSHELRTPVARIRFAIEMLVDTDDFNTRLKQQDKIDKDIDELDALIEEVLMYARLDSGQIQLKFKKGDLEQLAHRIAEEQQVLCDPGQEIRVDVTNSCSTTPEYEHTYIHRAIQNLVGNARRYCKSSILIQVEVSDLGCRVSVEDDGKGIPEDQRDGIFDPFARLDNSRARASGGHGLGLSIVRKIMDWHGGKAAATVSDELGGAKMVLFWPLDPKSGPDSP